MLASRDGDGRRRHESVIVWKYLGGAVAASRRPGAGGDGLRRAAMACGGRRPASGDVIWAAVVEVALRSAEACGVGLRVAVRGRRTALASVGFDR
jgi:hypothetical protein